MAALATLEELAARLGNEGISDPTRANSLLTDASAAVRSYTGQHFTRAITTDRLRARGEIVRLPQRPVRDVTAVTDVDGNARTFRWNGADTVYAAPFATAGAWWGARRQPLVDVTYEHGYDVIPEDIVAVVCNVAARALGVQPTEAAVTSQTITNYSESFGPVGAAGPIGLFDSEKLVLDRYRRVAAVAWTGRGL